MAPTAGFSRSENTWVGVWYWDRQRTAQWLRIWWREGLWEEDRKVSLGFKEPTLLLKGLVQGLEVWG